MSWALHTHYNCSLLVIYGWTIKFKFLLWAENIHWDMIKICSDWRRQTPHIMKKNSFDACYHLKICITFVFIKEICTATLKVVWNKNRKKMKIKNYFYSETNFLTEHWITNKFTDVFEIKNCKLWHRLTFLNRSLIWTFVLTLHVGVFSFLPTYTK